MTTRSTMFNLIQRTRTLIYDTGTPSAFAAEDIQNALDLRRTERRFVPLRPSPTFLAGGQIWFLDYYADSQNWEDDIKLQDASYNDITAQTDLAENMVGHWHFPSQPNGMGVRATGKTYDIYGAAADLLDAWAAQMKLDFNATLGGDTFQRAQKVQMILELAETYRKKALPITRRLMQLDATPDHDGGGGIVYPSLGTDHSIFGS